jgi:predicted CXXCH cytochrome family protein
MNKQKFVHPGAKRDCKKCHIKQVETEKEISVETYAMGNLIFLDVKDETSYSVRIRVRDREGRGAVSEEVKFTPSTITMKMINYKTPPLISNPRVEEVREGVFYSVELAWDTDEHSTSAVEYGLPGVPANLFSMGEIYTTDHRMTVGGLLPGKDYIFRVISRDPFGNTARSKDLRVKVKKKPSPKKDEPGRWPSVRGVGVVKVGEKTALRWMTSVETAAFVDLGEVVSGEGRSRGPHYPGFADHRFRGLYSCLSEGCHKGKIHRKTSHPTGSLSWKKAVRAPDLPLAAGGIMLCATCHTPHGGDHSFRLRKEERILCTACHMDFSMK